MCKPMRQREIVQIVESHGFVCVRNGEHLVYKKNGITLCVPYSKTVSSGMVHQIHKAIRMASQAA